MIKSIKQEKMQLFTWFYYLFIEHMLKFCVLDMGVVEGEGVILRWERGRLSVVGNILSREVIE